METSDIIRYQYHIVEKKKSSCNWKAWDRTFKGLHEMQCICIIHQTDSTKINF